MKKLAIIFALIISSMHAISQAQAFGFKDYSFSNQANIGGGLKNTNTSAWLELGPAAGGSTKGLLLPRGDRNLVVSPVMGLMFYDVNDKKVYQFTGSVWELVGNTSGTYINNQNGTAQTANFWIDGSGKFGGPVTVGNLSAAPTATNGAIYYNTGTDQFQAYRNGTWKDVLLTGDVSAADWNTLLNKPSTFTPASGSSFYVQNQNTAAQTSANFWIDGSGRAASFKVPGSASAGYFFAGSDNSFYDGLGYSVADVLTLRSLNSVTMRTNSNAGITVGTSYVQLSSPLLLQNFAGTPTGSNGAVYYNNSTHKFQGYVNGSWADFTTGGSGSFIQNQNTAAQTSANFWIDGSGKFGGPVTVGNIATAPTGANGAVFYNTTSNTFQGYQNGSWKNFAMQTTSFDLLANSIQSATGTDLTFKNTSGVIGFKMYSPASNQFAFTFNSNMSVLANQLNNGASQAFIVGNNATTEQPLQVTILNNDTYYNTAAPTYGIGIMSGHAFGNASFVSTGYHTIVSGKSYAGSLIFDDQPAATQPKGLFYLDANNSNVPFAINKDGTVTIKTLIFGNQAAAPSSPTNGATYYNTTTNKFQGYQNGAWVDFAAGTTSNTSTINLQTTDVGNVGTGEDDLMQYTLPAGTLANDGDRIVIDAWFYYAANTNTKNLKFYFGSAYNAVFSSSVVTSSGGPVHVVFTIIRTGAIGQKLTYTFQPQYGSFFESVSTAGETLSGSILLKFTADAVADNDITQKLITVTKHSAP